MFNFLTYRKLKTKHWNNLNATNRLKVIVKMEKIMARKQKRKPYLIQAKKYTNGTLGVCNYTETTISLSEDFFLKPNKQFLLLATLFHEERHIQQREIILKKKKVRRFTKAYTWQQELMAYNNYDGSDKYSYYSMQEVERDANRYAIKALKKMAFWFRKEDNYFNAVLEKQKDFNLVKEKAKEELGIFYKFKLFFRRHSKNK